MLAKQLAQRMNCFHFEKSNCYPQNSKKISNKENSLDVRFPPQPKKKKKIRGNNGQLYNLYLWKYKALKPTNILNANLKGFW